MLGIHDHDGDSFVLENNRLDIARVVANVLEQIVGRNDIVRESSILSPSVDDGRAVDDKVSQ